MRRTKRSGLPLFLLAAVAISSLSLRSQEPQGKDDSQEAQKATLPRSSAGQYKAHATHGDLSVGAELLTRKEVTKQFLADVNSCCIVVQVAVYPGVKAPWKLSLDDFSLVIEGTDATALPQRPATLSAKLSRPSTSGVTATGTVGVEVGTYADPATGQTVHGHAVVTEASVGVGAGSNAPPSAAERDRQIIERELSEKSLPDAKISVPVSGYLYFSFPKRSLPKDKKALKYHLEYTIKDETLVLPLS